MLQYVIHIGLPKTGTKYFQSNCRRYSDELAAEGVLYPSEWWTSGSDVNHDAMLAALSDPGASWLDDSFRRFRQSSFKTILLSCEGLVSMRHEQLLRLRELTAGSPVSIVFICRRWSDWIPSSWLQAIKVGNLRTFPEFLAETLARPERFPAINFEPALQSFINCFGEEGLRIASYSNAVDGGGDIAKVILNDILGLKIDLTSPEALVHRSINILTAEIVRGLNILERAETGSSGVAGYKRLERLARDTVIKPMVEALTEVMQDSVADIVIDDSNYVFQTLFSRLTDRFRNSIIPVGGKTSFFEPRRRRVQYVKEDYLLRSAAVNQIKDLRSALIDREKASSQNRERRASAQGVSNAEVVHEDSPVRFIATQSATSAYLFSELPRFIEISFGSTGTADKVVRSGWSKPELDYRWTDGQDVVLELPKPTTPTNYKLALWVRPFLVRSKIAAQQVGIKVNGHDLGTVLVKGVGIIECNLQWDILAPANIIDVQMSLPNATRPVDVIDSADVRMLGLRFERAVLFVAEDISE